MKKIISILAVLCLLPVVLTGCGYSSIVSIDEQPIEQHQQPLDTPTDEPPLTSEQIEIDSENPARAYFVVFQYLFEADSALNYGIKYIALDLSEMIFEMPDKFIHLVEEFCDEFGFTLLLYNADELVEKGYIIDYPLPSIFTDGIIISFRDITLTDDTLITEASKWRSGRGAIGATFTVEKVNSSWDMLPLEYMFIS